jgi:hypothetical protein
MILNEDNFDVVREEESALGDSCVVRQLSAYHTALLMYSSYQPIVSILTSEALEMGQTQANDPESFGILFHRSFRPSPALAYMSLRYIHPDERSN